MILLRNIIFHGTFKEYERLLCSIKRAFLAKKTGTFRVHKKMGALCPCPRFHRPLDPNISKREARVENFELKIVVYCALLLGPLFSIRGREARAEN